MTDSRLLRFVVEVDGTDLADRDYNRLRQQLLHAITRILADHNIDWTAHRRVSDIEPAEKPLSGSPA
jgi:hypothetical protein